METPRDQCMKEDCTGCKHCTGGSSINFRAVECEGCGAILNGNNPELVKAHQRSCILYMELVKRQAEQAINETENRRPEPNEEALKEQWKIEIPFGYDEFEGDFNIIIKRKDWEKLVEQINYINNLIEQAPVLYGRGGMFGEEHEIGLDTHMCLGLGIQEIGQDSKDKLIEDIASFDGVQKDININNSSEVADLVRRAKKLKERDSNQ